MTDVFIVAIFLVALGFVLYLHHQNLKVVEALLHRLMNLEREVLEMAANDRWERADEMEKLIDSLEVRVKRIEDALTKSVTGRGPY